MVENELDILRDVTQRLEQLEIAFMLTGSLAMNYYAKPRMTRDIDLVIQLESDDVEPMVRAFESDYYIDRLSVVQALNRRGMFNLIHNLAVIKVDCVVLKNNEYRKLEFERRRKISFADIETWVVSREDLILSKLAWAQDSHSEMQLEDVKNLLGPDCDFTYLHQWAVSLGVVETINRLVAEYE